MIHLYIKEHNKTGLKYFGKTTRDPFKYQGSGKYWRRHIKKHGYDVTTKLIGSFEDEQLAEDFAISFSIENNIIDNPEWANLILENSKDGAPKGRFVSVDTKKKISSSLIGRKSPKSKYIMTETREERSKRSREAAKGKVWVNNGKESKRVYPDSIPEGYNLGRLGHFGNKDLGKLNNGSNTRGKKIFNNGERHKYFVPGEEPEGWVAGKMEGYQGGTGAMKKGKKYAPKR